MTEMSGMGMGPIPEDHLRELAQAGADAMAPRPDAMPIGLGMRREDEGATQQFIEILQTRNDHLRQLIGRQHVVLDQILGAEPEVASPGFAQPAEVPGSKIQWIKDLLEENARLLGLLESVVMRMELRL